MGENGGILDWLLGLIGPKSAEAAEPVSKGPALAFRGVDPASVPEGYAGRLFADGQVGFEWNGRRHDVRRANEEYRSLVEGPLGQDTLRSILGVALPDRAVQTYKTSVRSDDELFLGEYTPNNREILLSGLLPNDNKRNTLLHESGHAVVMENPAFGDVPMRREPQEQAADLFASIVDVLGGRPHNLRAAAVEAIAGVNNKRAGRETGDGAHDAKIPYNEEWINRAETMTKMVLRAPVYKDAPLNNKQLPTKAEAAVDIIKHGPEDLAGVAKDSYEYFRSAFQHKKLTK